MKAHLILYVSDQKRSSAFYSTVLGLMTEEGIVRLLGDTIADPSTARGIPRSELYLVVPDPAVFHARAIAAGARELSSLSPRDWGDSVAYSLDPDGHISALASPTEAGP